MIFFYQTIVEHLPMRVTSARTDSGHIQTGPQPFAAPADVAAAPERAAVAVVWRYTRQGGDFLAGQVADLGQNCEQGGRRYAAQAFDRLYPNTAPGLRILLREHWCREKLS